jgi:hypothetical protein
MSVQPSILSFILFAGAGELGTMNCFKGGRSLSVLALVDIYLKFRYHSAFNCGGTVDGRAHDECSLKRDIDAGDFPPADSPVVVHFSCAYCTLTGISL